MTPAAKEGSYESHSLPGRNPKSATVQAIALRSPGLHAADLLARERSAEDVGAHQLLMSGVHHRLVLDLLTQVTQDLHRALIGYMRARRMRQPAVAVDRHALDAVGRE